MFWPPVIVNKMPRNRTVAQKVKWRASVARCPPNRA
jgi:hypothetical protein